MIELIGKFKTSCFWIKDGLIHFVDFNSGVGYLVGIPPTTGSISTGWINGSNGMKIRPGIKTFYNHGFGQTVNVPPEILGWHLSAKMNKRSNKQFRTLGFRQA